MGARKPIAHPRCDASSVFLLLSICYALPVGTSVFDPFSPRSYREGDNILIKANSLTSTAGGMPFPAYSVKLCTPPKQDFEHETVNQSISQVFLGDRIEPSLYRASFLRNVTCRELCRPLALRSKDKATLSRRIDQHYRMNLVLDNLPLVEKHVGAELRKSYLPSVLKGCPLGFSAGIDQSDESRIVYNHLDLTIEYSAVDNGSEKKPFGPEPEPQYRIVGFYGSPRSIKHTLNSCTDGAHCSLAGHDVLTLGAETQSILWTYSVTWRKQSILWSTRWDMYLHGSPRDSKIQWVSLMNSIAVLILLTAMVALIITRTVKRDFLRYRDVGASLADEFAEETGWKLVHGDVFRNPRRADLFALIVGSGAQVLAVLVIGVFFGLLGYLSPESRGAMLSMFIVCFILLGCVNGYVTARLTKTFRIARWSHVLKSAAYLPGAILLLYMPLNIVQSYKSSSSELPASDVLILIGCWLFVSFPLIFAGGLYGFRQRPMRMPCSVNPIPRAVPVQPWYLRSRKILLLAGVVPFSAAFVQLVYILSSIWQGRLYCMFGFISAAIFIVAVTTAEVAIIITYYQLVNEDYRWWWTSLFASATPGVYLFLYSWFYYVTSLPMRQISSTIVYFGYMFILSLLLALCTGTIGCYASFLFVRYIYSHVRID